MTHTVVVNEVTFPSEGDELVGNFYRPRDTVEGAYPAVVVAGSWTTVKEQMAGLYAAGLAARGLAALAFDFRGFGESGGEPRDFESPDRKVTDIRSAIDFLETHPAVDAGRIGALGICAGAGYTVVNAARDDRVRSIALVAPWLHNAELVGTVYEGDEGVRRRVTAGEAARKEYERGGEVNYVPAVSTEDTSAAMYGSFDYYLNTDRGAIPQWPNRFAVMSWPGWLGFDPISVASSIVVPTLMVHSPDAAIPDGARRFHEELAGPKELRWLTGSQFDFYDQKSTVDAVLAAVNKHFLDTL